jgi:hypothetical protein
MRYSSRLLGILKLKLPELSRVFANAQSPNALLGRGVSKNRTDCRRARQEKISQLFIVHVDYVLTECSSTCGTWSEIAANGRHQLIKKDACVHSEPFYAEAIPALVRNEKTFPSGYRSNWYDRHASDV